ncbi:MAG: hypothetical protein ACRER2_18885, partial [Methylococcales bacterium]
MVRSIVRLTFLILLSFAVHGGTIVDLRDRNGRDSQFFTDDQMARLDLAERKTYIILDYATQDAKVVMPNRMEVLDLSGKIPSFVAGASIADQTTLRIEIEGEGPTVAGYPTRQYKLSRNGEYCGTVLASKQALEDTGTARTFKSLQKVADKLADSIATLAYALSPCERAMANTLDQVASIGAPLKSVNRQGQVDLEVTRIRTDVGLPPNTFAIPSDYKLVTAAQKMQQVE